MAKNDVPPLLEMKNITKDFFGNQVLTDVHLVLREGEVLGLVGENGAGKSTLMEILFGMDVIKKTGGYQGDIIFGGKKVFFDSPFDALNAGIGMVHQEFSLIPGFTANENILLNREPTKQNVASEIFGERLNTLDKKKMARLSEIAIEKLGVKISPEMKISEMPIGHKQFTEIARELSKEHLKLLILDEPTAVLTEKEALSLIEAIRSMADKGIAVIFITHRLEEILTVCDQVVIMRDGHVIKDVPANKTDVMEITKAMVGRQLQTVVQKNQGSALDAKAQTAMSIKRLWVDMPGEIVRDVSIDVKKGEILGIGGLAGQGKLGIPNGIMGLYEAGGSVFLNGKQIPLNNPRKCLDQGLAFVSEDRRGVGLLLDESLEWNISFGAMQIQNKFLKKFGFVKWRDEKAIKKVTQKYIDSLNIKCTSSKQKARELSGGNQQKVCLAKAFALEPEFLFVSEPTRGIDVGAKALVLEAIKKLNQVLGVTVVMISSELEELRSTCDRIAIVSGGMIAGILPAYEPSEKFGMLMVSRVK